MPSTERFRARPMWACLEPCPLREITSFVEDSSRSRKSIVKLFKSHTSFSGHPRIEGTRHVIVQAANFADISRGQRAWVLPPRHQNAFPPTPVEKRSRIAVLAGLSRFTNPVALRRRSDIANAIHRKGLLYFHCTGTFWTLSWFSQDGGSIRANNPPPSGTRQRRNQSLGRLG